MQDRGVRGDLGDAVGFQEALAEELRGIRGQRLCELVGRESHGRAKREGNAPPLQQLRSRL